MNRLLAAVFALAVISAAAYAEEISVARGVPSAIALSQQFDVSLGVALNGNDPSGIIITEEIPEGWEIIGSDDCVVNEEQRIVKCLAYGENITAVMKYRLRAPAQKPAETAAITGTWKTLTSEGNVGGGALDIIGQAQPEENGQPPAETPAGEDNFLLLAGIGIAAILLVALIAIVLVLGRRKKKGKRNKKQGTTEG